MEGKNVLFMVAVLLTYIVQGAIWYTMPLLFSQTLASNYLAVGLLISLVPLIEVIVAIPFGYFADFGKIKQTAFSSMLSLLVVPFLFATNISVLDEIGVFMLGIGGMGIWIAATAHVAYAFGRKIRFIGYEFALMEIGWITGPALGGFLLGALGSSGLALAEMLMLAVSSFAFIKSLKVKNAVKHKNAPKLLRILTMQKRVWYHMPFFIVPFLIMSFLWSFFSYAIWVAVPLLAAITNSSIFLGGMIVGAIEIPFALGDAFAGRLYRKGSEKATTGVAILLSAIFMLISAFLLQLGFYALIVLMVSALFLTYAAVGVVSAVMQKGKRYSGEIAAFSAIAGGVGGAVAAMITGATLAEYRLYVVAGIFCFLVAIYLFYAHIVLRRYKF
jgi:MFS family permease